MPNLDLKPLRPFGAEITAPLAGARLEDLPLTKIGALVREHKFLLFRGFAELGREAFLEYVRDRLGRALGLQTLDWDFGPVMEMKETPDAKNYLFSRERVPFHWDGAFHKAPRYLVFNCIEAPAPDAGGETLFCNTQKIWSEAPSHERELWSKATLTYQTAKVAHYGGGVSTPLVGYDDEGQPILRFAEPVTTKLNPVSLQINGIDDDKRVDLLKNLTDRIYDNRYCHKHAWTKADFVIADNQALIHGRTSFAKDCPRHLRRIQLI